MLFRYRINSIDMNRATVVRASAKELSIGITKLSGSKPRLNVKIEMANDKTMIAEKAITLEIKSIGSKLISPLTVSIPFIVSANTPSTANSISDAAQALRMFFA